MMSKTISHWIDNKPFAGSSTATAPVTNPATGEVTGQVALASVQDALALPGVRGLTVGRTLLYPPDGDVAGAVDTAAAMVHPTLSVTA